MIEPSWIDSHMHTPLCKHAYGEPALYAESALARGLSGITFTCHSPMPEGWWPSVRMGEHEFDTYVAMVEAARLEYAGRLDIRLGIESDWFPGMERWLSALHQRAPLHHVLGSVHFFSPPYMDQFFRGEVISFQKGYFAHLADSAESGLFDTLAHPDLVKNISPQEWAFEQVEDAVHNALARIAKTGVAMELNTSGLHKNVSEMNPGPAMLKLIHAYGIPVVVGSDAHHPSRVAADFEQALDALETAGFHEVSYFLSREKRALPISAARASLAALAPA